jgi:DNA-binding NarL/FixJ family response regulator
MTPDAVRVWLIEDNVPYRLGVARAINRMPGFVCERDLSYEDAREAFAGSEPPNVLLLDVGLPALDGISALTEIRRLCPRTQVVILTVFDDAG